MTLCRLVSWLQNNWLYLDFGKGKLKPGLKLVTILVDKNYFSK